MFNSEVSLLSALSCSTPKECHFDPHDLRCILEARLRNVRVLKALVYLAAIVVTLDPRIYHYIRGESFLKLYVLFNMLAPWLKRRLSVAWIATLASRA